MQVIFSDNCILKASQNQQATEERYIYLVCIKPKSCEHTVVLYTSFSTRPNSTITVCGLHGDDKSDIVVC